MFHVLPAFFKLCFCHSLLCSLILYQHPFISFRPSLWIIKAGFFFFSGIGTASPISSYDATSVLQGRGTFRLTISYTVADFEVCTGIANEDCNDSTHIWSTTAHGYYSSKWVFVRKVGKDGWECWSIGRVAHLETGLGRIGLWLKGNKWWMDVCSCDVLLVMRRSFLWPLLGVLSAWGLFIDLVSAVVLLLPC